MEEKKVILEIKSSLATPLQSDTIFGHFCWAIKYRFGESVLVDFLDKYKESPPIIFSNGFPADFLPKALLDPISAEEAEEMIKARSGNDENNKIDTRRKIKSLRKESLIPLSVYKDLKEKINDKNLIIALLDDKEIQKPQAIEEEILHNTINRMTNRTGEGEGISLFGVRETFYITETRFVFYIKYDRDFKFNDGTKLDDNLLADIMKNQIFEFGFGKKKTTGKGRFELESLEGSDLPHSEKSNSIMSLSNFVPDKSLPSETNRCFYNLKIKRGAIGGDWANNNNITPFKKPILMMTAGSVFKIDGEINDYYGSLLENVHPQLHSVKQHAYLFPLKLNIM